MTSEEILLVNELWQLWKNLAEAGEIKIGGTFNNSYDKLRLQVNQLNDKRNVARGEEKVCLHTYTTKYTTSGKTYCNDCHKEL